MKRNNTLAIQIDRKILKLDPFDTYIIAHLSKLYRSAGQPEQAVQIFRDVNYVVEHRSFFCEWALIEANMGNKAASVCLSAIAMSDEVERKMIDIRNAHINLYSITLTFLELYRLYRNEFYFLAMASAWCLYERIGSQEERQKRLDLHEDEKVKFETIVKEERNLEDDLKKGIKVAEAMCEVDFWEGTPKIINLEYHKLFLLADIVL